MQTPDLVEVARVANAAFGHIIGQMTGRAAATPVLPPLLFSTRLAADPAGCFVATGETNEISGAVFSIARGTLGWLGPLAVSPDVQGRGVGQALIAGCLESLRGRGVRLVGLETFADSPFHVHLYSKFGFRPSWTGVGFRRNIAPVRMPTDVTTDGAPPDLDFVYEGLDVAAEVATTESFAVGTTYVTEGGLAVCHFAPTFEAEGTGFLPFVAASSRPAFDRLLDAAEHACGERGFGVLTVRVPGSSWQTIDALVARDYRAGRVEVRMKLGARPDYDSGNFFYGDNWL
ncbi:MAG TPA: GNAT family N-acetyltransferase [Acidimicrobiales bacterium]|nr:GNAT family N-acetyltransferase [Acidimicrobiales bacterium]